MNILFGLKSSCTLHDAKTFAYIELKIEKMRWSPDITKDVSCYDEIITRAVQFYHTRGRDLSRDPFVDVLG